ncbi:hypothetical protein [uncultured Chryseobacterium sp.]|uniref:hypothetical protein n=1 Tax=uncultured Chryseobacterium sp. TaxID=259322 RepID=UPI0025DF1857|nr:hypothetical protein [uncultured Chryseobacterium sp.]
MKPTKDNLRDELEYRLQCLDESIPIFDANTQLFFKNEYSVISEIIGLIDKFGIRQGFKTFEQSKYTPIVDYETKEPLLLGDLVKSGSSTGCGHLHFDTYTNQYVIKTAEGGHHKTSSFIKIPELYEYTMDISKVECRPNPHKKKW